MKAILKQAIACMVVAGAIGGCASSANIQSVADKPTIQVERPEQTRPIQFRKIVIKLKRGEDIGAIEGGLLCAPQADLVFRGGRMTLDDEELSETFKQELEVANYQVVGDPNALFEDPSTWQAEYLVAGLVKRMQANICYPMIGWGGTEAKGEAFMDVGWQIYSRLDRKVVYELSTQGSSKIEESRPTGEVDVFLDAFAQATRNLLADKGFHDLITGQASSVSTGTAAPATNVVIAGRAAFQGPASDNMSTIRANVVTVFAGGGHGSGVLIDGGGHVLTNEHVVRTAKRVKVKFENGEEFVGDVVAADARRDVALISIGASGHGGLPLRLGRPTIGSEVYAIGSPLDEKLSATVSKGIVSAYRVVDGIEWIQSDVNVQHGNSGGPLLDANGNVIGIASWGRADEGFPAGINFFIPIDDALARLGIRMTSAAT